MIATRCISSEGDDLIIIGLETPNFKDTCIISIFLGELLGEEFERKGLLIVKNRNNPNFLKILKISRELFKESQMIDFFHNELDGAWIFGNSFNQTFLLAMIPDEDFNGWLLSLLAMGIGHD